MNTHKKATRAAIYARISDDPEGREAGVQRQVEDCERMAEQLGWTLAPYKPFIDNDLSASTLSKKRRPEYERMMELVGDGEVDGVLFYTNGRLTRRPREYEDIIDLYMRTGVLLKSVKSVDADLSTADGRMIARVLAAQDAAEAERISERVRRANVQRRAAGRPEPSSRSFGFEKGGEVIIEREAELIREAVDRIINENWSLGMVVNDWNARKIPTLRGAKTWTRIQIGRALTSPRTAGLVSFKDEIIGPGSFGEIITPSQRLEVIKRLKENRKNMVSYKQRVHWLSGLLVCGKCGGPVKINALYHEDGSLRKDAFVHCSRQQHGCGKLKRNYLILLEYLDLIVRKRIELWEPTGDVDESNDESHVTELRRQLEQVNEDVEDLQEAFRSKTIRFRDYNTTLAMLREQEDALRAAITEAETRSEVDIELDLLETWEQGSVEEKRAIAEHFIDHIVIHPTGKIGPIRIRETMPQTTEIVYK